MAQRVRTMGVLAMAGVAASLAGAAAAQVTPGSQQWLGLTGADIPPLLKTVAADPYREPAAPACQTIPQEILALDQVLGPDIDLAQPKTGLAHKAVDYVRHMIPYRGYVRFLTRADAKDKALQAAATAGIARRAFLRGLEAHMQCAPAAETKVAEASDRVPLIELGPVEAVPPPASELKVPEPAIVQVQVADARPAAQAGDDLARQMLTPVATPPVAAAPAEPAAEPGPAQGRVVYQLVDSVSGRPILADPAPDAGR